MSTCVVTGGAGFLGSHLCELPARAGPPGHLPRQPRHRLAAEHRAPARRRPFEFRNLDVVEFIDVDEPVDFVFHLASPASPIDYLRLPLQTLKVGSYGTHNALGLAKFKRARFLLASTSRGLRRPAGASAARGLLGQRQPDRPARRLRRGEALRRGADDGLPPPAGRRHRDRAHLQHLRPAHAAQRRPRACPPSCARRSQDKPLTVFGDGSQTRSFCYVDDLIDGLFRLATSPASTSRSTSATRTRADDARARRDGHPRSPARERDRLRGAADRRPEGAPARHHHAPASCSAGSRRSSCATACARRSSRPASSAWSAPPTSPDPS